MLAVSWSIINNLSSGLEGPSGDKYEHQNFQAKCTLMKKTGFKIINFVGIDNKLV